MWAFIFNAATHVWTVREWAPLAQAVFLIGDFNGWSRESHPLELQPNGVWQLKLPADALAHGQMVKLHVVGADDSRRDRIPACIRRAVQDPTTHDYSGQIWNPPEPYVWKHEFDPASIGAPLIYESHVGMGGEEPRVHTYREFADNVLPRVKKAGYNTVQLMAVQEHPYYGSFGYHVSSFFAPCSRFGTPEDLKYLIDTAHGLGLAVLLDIVHSHAVKNMAEGLNDFDGSGHQYFHGGDARRASDLGLQMLRLRPRGGAPVPAFQRALLAGGVPFRRLPFRWRHLDALSLARQQGVREL